METNIYKDLNFSMNDIENIITNSLMEYTKKNWYLNNIIFCNKDLKKAQIYYYAFDDNTPNPIPHIFYSKNKICGIKEKERNFTSTVTYTALKVFNEQDLIELKEQAKVLEDYINSKKAILIGTLNVDINSKTDVYNLLSEYYNKHNYLDNSTAFFCYNENYDYLTNEIIKFAEMQKNGIQKKLN